MSLKPPDWSKDTVAIYLLYWKETKRGTPKESNKTPLWTIIKRFFIDKSLSNQNSVATPPFWDDQFPSRTFDLGLFGFVFGFLYRWNKDDRPAGLDDLQQRTSASAAIQIRFCNIWKQFLSSTDFVMCLYFVSLSALLCVNPVFSCCCLIISLWASPYLITYNNQMITFTESNFPLKNPAPHLTELAVPPKSEKIIWLILPMISLSGAHCTIMDVCMHCVTLTWNWQLGPSGHDEPPFFEGVEVETDETGDEARVLEAAAVDVCAEVDEEAVLASVLGTLDVHSHWAQTRILRRRIWNYFYF